MTSCFVWNVTSRQSINQSRKAPKNPLIFRACTPTQVR